MNLLTILSWFQNVLKWIVEIDKKIFLSINQQHTNPFFDWLMPILRNSNTWIPLYIIILVFASFKLKQKAIGWFLFAILTILFTDQISSHLIKPYIARPRPCSDIEFVTQVRLLLKHCSGGYSFTSSHACNHFGIALFFITTLSKYFYKWKYLFIIWAALICYAQVYVGVHYPFDVLCGGILGAIIGKIIGNWCNRKLLAPQKIEI